LLDCLIGTSLSVAFLPSCLAFPRWRRALIFSKQALDILLRMGRCLFGVPGSFYADNVVFDTS
jgi:hypothetical protein